MGAGGEDLVMARAAREKFPFSIECKNVERIQLWKSIKQAEDNTKEGSEIALVVKRNQTKPYVVIDLQHWLELIG